MSHKNGSFSTIVKFQDVESTDRTTKKIRTVTDNPDQIIRTTYRTSENPDRKIRITDRANLFIRTGPDFRSGPGNHDVDYP